MQPKRAVDLAQSTYIQLASKHTPSVQQVFFNPTRIQTESGYSLNAGSELKRNHISQNLTMIFRDLNGHRILPHKPNTPIPAEEMTIEKCLDGCGASGYTTGGVEFAQYVFELIEFR